MLLCLFLCALPIALPALVHGAIVAILAFGIGADDVPLTFAPYSAPFADVETYVAPPRPSIRMPSPPCKVSTVHTAAVADMPIIRAPRSASGRFGSVRYSGSNESYNLSLTVSG